MPVNQVPTLGWTRGSVAATIQLVTQQQRDEIAARVRAEMARQGLTNPALARKADLAEKTISRLINARRDARYDTLDRVSRALGVDLRPTPVAPLGLGQNGNGSDEVTQLDRIEAKLDALIEQFVGAEIVRVATQELAPTQARRDAARHRQAS